MGQDAIEIRKATQSDLMRIAELQSGSQMLQGRIAAEGFGERLRSPKPIEAWVEEFKEALNDEDSLLYVAVNSEIVAAFVFAQVEEYGDDLIEAPYMSVVFIATDPKFQGMGLAKQLLSKVEKVSAERGFSVVELLVIEENSSARGLYEKHGFITLERRMAKRIKD